MSSFKSPQPSPLGLVLSLARSLGLVSTVDDVVIVPLSQWHAMHERHTADSEALRSALARVVEVEALSHWAAKSHTEMAELAKRDRENMAKLRAENERLTAELATARGQK